MPFPRIDLVVCRNLLIYFQPELQQHVLDLFAYSLSHTGGFLFLGKAETARPSNAAFELVDKRWKVFRCTRPPVTFAAHRAGVPVVTPFAPSFSHDEGRAARRTPDRPIAHEPQLEPETSPARRFEELLLRSLPVGVAVVDRSYRLLTINALARRLLGIRELGHEQDFLHAIRGLPYGEVRDGIDQVFRERGPVTLPELEIDRVGATGVRFLTLSLSWLQADGQGLELAVVSVADATEAVQARRNLEAVQSEQSRLLAELTNANKRLSDMNKDLQDANEELEATNEELTARTQELQDVARTLSNERARLTELIERAPMHVLVLRGPTLVIDACNAPFAQLLRDRDWPNRPIEEVLNEPERAQVIPAIRDAYWSDKASDAVSFTTTAGEPLTCTIVPSHDTTGKVDGVIVFGHGRAR